MDTPGNFCVFSAGGTRFGIAAAAVEEVIERPAVLPLPLAPRPLLGVVHWRQQVVPLLHPRLASDWQHALVVRAGAQQWMAIAADSVEEGLQPTNGFAAIDLDQVTLRLRTVLAEAFRGGQR